MKSWILSVGVVLFLAACGSTVPLNDVPVADATPKIVSGADTQTGTGAGTVVQSGGVAPVDLGGGGGAQASLPGESRIIYFDYDSYVIKPEYQSVIASHARFIKGQASRKVAIEGHTDERGGREYNLALGQRRADAVLGALTILGVSASQVESVSFGKEKPASLGTDEAAFAKNRRTEIRYQ